MIFVEAGGRISLFWMKYIKYPNWSQELKTSMNGYIQGAFKWYHRFFVVEILNSR